MFILYFAKKNNNIYIGQSSNLIVRLKDHTNALLKTKHRNKKMQNIFDKYGFNSFYCGIFVFTENLDFYEELLISYFLKLKICVNCDTGGNKNKIISMETRKKLSESAKKRFLTKEHPMKNKVFSEEYRKKLSDAHIGLSSPRKGIKTGKPSWNSGKVGVQVSKKRIRISVYDDLEKKEIGVFESISHFTKKINYKSKNQKKLSDNQTRLGKYILTKI